MSTPAVVLANGSYPTHATPLSVLARAPFLCCCDGAAAQALAHGLQPDAVVGDGDSLPPPLRARLAGILHLVAEQDDNDLTKATRFCVARGFRSLDYVAATGGREDHTLANIFLMARYLRDFGVRPRLFTDHGVFTPIMGTVTLGSFPRQQVSLFNVSCAHLSGEGLRWPASAWPELWQGTLNEAAGSSFSLRADGVAIVFQTYAPKGQGELEGA